MRTTAVMTTSAGSIPAVAFAFLLLAGAGSGCDDTLDRTARAQTSSSEEAARQRSASHTPPALDARRVWTWEMPAGSEALDLYAGGISPDGRYLTEINWTTGDLAMIDLETGETWDVTGKGYNYGGRDGRWAWFSKFSPDGRRLAVNFFLTEQESFELRLMNRDGSGSRVLVPARPDPGVVQPQDWSPDGDHLLAAIGRADGTWQIGLVSLEDGSLRVLKSLGWRYDYTTELAFSADGEWIAYEYSSEEDRGTGNIYVIKRDGSRHRQLLGSSADEELLGWTPDGEAILFYSDRSGTPGIWTLPVEDGRPAGPPELRRPDVWGLEPMGSTRDGFAYAVHVERPRVHTAILDVRAGEIVGSARPVDDRPSRRSSAPAWSPEGDRLAYLHHGTGGARGTAVMIQSADGEVTRNIPLRSVSGGRWLHWADEDEILLRGHDRKDRPGIYRLSLKDGSVSLVRRALERDGNFTVGPGPNGLTEYRVRTRASDLDRPHHEIRELLIARDFSTGEETVLDTAHMGKSLDVSPDGSELVYTVHDDTAGTFELRVVPTGGGEGRVVHRRNSDDLNPGVAWTPDGKEILLHTPNPETEGTVLHSIAAAGGEPRKVLELPRSSGIAFPLAITAHPAGARIAFVGGAKRGELWMLEGFSAGEPAPSDEAADGSERAAAGTY